MAKKGVIMYYDLLEQLQDFSDEDFGKITRAMIEYDKSGTLPNFKGELKIAFNFIKLSIDRNKEEYEQKCEKNRENAMKRWNANECDRIQSDAMDADKDIDTDKDTEKEIDKDNDNKKKNMKKKNSLDIISEFVFNEATVNSINLWVKYKSEKHQGYKETGFRTLLKKLNDWEKEYGYEYVVDAIENSICQNYDGIFPNKNKVQSYHKKDNFMEMLGRKWREEDEKEKLANGIN